ncbi:hypothetical protein [Curtobacterium luteum]|uniref:hypothetical protein n=1 Tax=Curtobacterium luteum TaxID=33881 RepID=UPI003809CD69
MPASTTVPRPLTGRTPRVLATLTATALALAVGARIAVDVVEARASGPVRYSSVPPVDWYPVVSTTLAQVAVASIGAGVLLFGALLVAFVRRSRRPRLPWVIGAWALTLAITATACSIEASTQTSFVGMTEWTTWRTALAGLAAACLPALCLAAVRTRATRAR